MKRKLAMMSSAPLENPEVIANCDRKRFPNDFVFDLTATEIEELNRSQFVTGSQKHRDPRFPPCAFTEHGAIMAATILNSTHQS